MKYHAKFAVLGGDTRTAKLAELLAADGHNTAVFALERAALASNVRVCPDFDSALLDADFVILPLPALGQPGMLNTPLSAWPCRIDDVLAAIRPKQCVFAGRTDLGMQTAASNMGIKLFDYYDREELTVANAAATAEGAIQLAMEETPITLCSSRCLVIGYGRIGRLLSPRLRALGAHVSVSSRKYSDMAWCRAFGFDVLDTRTLEGHLSDFDIVINTVPARVLGEECLKELKSGCLCMDLASKPGGMDFEAASRLGVKALWALSLPGAVAPQSSGAIIRDAIYNILSEEGLWI